MAVMNPVMGPPMGPTTIGTVEYIGASIDPDVVLWAGAIRANGGSISDDDLLLASQFVTAERAAGAYALTDDYWPLWLPTEVAARTSLKQRRLMTMTGSPTHTANRGYAFNGSTQFGDTGFSPASHGVNCIGTNQRLAVYERTNTSDVNTTAGAVDVLASRSLLLINRNGTAAGARANTGSLSFTLAVADSRALKAVSRTGSTARLYDRGTRLTDVTGLSPGTAAPTNTLYIGARNNVGVADAFRACSVGFSCIGGQLSDAQELAQYNNVQAWAAAKGANV